MRVDNNAGNNNENNDLSMNELAIVVNAGLSELDENDTPEVTFDKRILLMSLIDKWVHYNDTVYDFNVRLRASVANMFNKGMLSDDHINSFIQWSNNLEGMPMNSSRLAIFGQASIGALNVVGL